MSLPIPPLQDVVRLTGPDVPTTVANYRRHLQGTGPVWGYDPAKRLARAVFSLELNRNAAVESCGRIGHAAGRPHNREVAGLIWDDAAERGRFMCHDLAPRLLNLRADISIKVDPQFFFVEAGRPTIFYLQPRRGHVPGHDGLRAIATAIHSLFAVDDLVGANLMLLDLSAPPKSDERAVVAYTLADLPLMPNDEIERLLQRFVDAYDVLSAEGIVRPTRRPRPRPDRGDDLFGTPPAE